MINGFVKVASACPEIRVADTEYNARQVVALMREAADKGVKVLVFPELTLTGCTCYDIITHKVILDGAKDALKAVITASKGMDMLTFVGLPFAVASRVYSCAAAVCDGELIALVPREHVRGSHFSIPDEEPTELVFDGESVTLDTECLFESAVLPELKVAVELGADMDAVVPSSVRHALAGATVIAQMAAFPATVDSSDAALLNARFLSKRLRCGLILAAPGKGESTTDNVFTGLRIITENGEQLECAEDGCGLTVSELDVEHMTNLRRESDEFDDAQLDFSSILWGKKLSDTVLTRAYAKHPHLPTDSSKLPAYCRRMIEIQTAALVKRMEYAHLDHCVVGISGGVDSTLAVMISARAVKRMGLPSTNVVACTMPCFGTSSRTKSNAIIVSEQIGAEVRVIDIGKAVYQHFDDIGHAHDDYSIAFENAQARERTQVLMDIANKVNGLDVGTEDLSEFVDGWCTYNGDHTSMYDVNLGMTKTQVRAAVRYIADTTDDEILRASLLDVLDCPVTPELLPIHDDQIEQKSENTVGSYSLQDFFTHMIMIRGFSPSKTARLAKLAYGDEYTQAELKRWLTSYCKRYFSQQFKRSCLMDGPAVEAFTVSPRTGFLIPSDGESALFLKELEKL